MEQVVGHRHDHGELDEFRWLDAQPAPAQPGSGAVNLFADRQHQQQRGNAQQVPDGGPLANQAVINQGRDQEQCQAHREPNYLHPVIIRYRLVRAAVRGAVNEQHTQHGQHTHRPHQDPVQAFQGFERVAPVHRQLIVRGSSRHIRSWPRPAWRFSRRYRRRSRRQPGPRFDRRWWRPRSPTPTRSPDCRTGQTR